MIIEETHDAFGLSCIDFDTGGDMMDIVQQGNWIQIDKHQATQLITVLQKWVDVRGGWSEIHHYGVR